MRRIRLRTGRAALFGAMLAVALLLLLPMRLALGWLGLGEQGLAARQVAGSLWGATLSEARFGALPLGDLHAALSPGPLLLGRARVELRGAGDGPALSGAALVSRHLLGVDRLSATLPTGDLFAPLPVTSLDLQELSVRFRDGGCEAADGRVRATLAGQAASVALPPVISGVARCEGAALLLPLASQAGTEQVDLRVEGGGGYRADLLIRPTDPLVGQRLEGAGFVAGADGYRLSVTGSF